MSSALSHFIEAQIAARATMYINSAREAFERAKSRAWGIPKLPQYPGDGRTECLTNCKCHWEIKRVADGWEATWVLDPEAESCQDCIDNGRYWNPLYIDASGSYGA